MLPFECCCTVQAEVQALQGEIESLVSACECDSSSFSTAYSQAALQEQHAALQQAEAAAAAGVAQLKQSFKEKHQALTQQKAAALHLKQQVSDSHAAISSVKQLIAAESAASTELMGQLQLAETEGPAAQQLAALKQELGRREEGLLEQKCRWGGVINGCW